MFGLKKCKEEDFYKFKYSNLEYQPNGINLRIFVGILCNVIFLGIASFYLTQNHIECPKFLSYGIKIFILIDIILFILCTVNNKKYAFKYQKIMVIAVLVNWIVMSLCMYPIPIIMSLYEKNITMLYVIIIEILIGVIFFIFIFFRLIYLIKKGKMREGNLEVNEELLGQKFVYLGGCSVPVIVSFSKFSRRTAIEMNKRGDDIGAIIFTTILAFVMQIAMISIILECILVIYCKFRFESFNIEPRKAFKKKKRKK